MDTRDVSNTRPAVDRREHREGVTIDDDLALVVEPGQPFDQPRDCCWRDSAHGRPFATLDAASLTPLRLTHLVRDALVDRAAW
jgi:hypothetical protein